MKRIISGLLILLCLLVLSGCGTVNSPERFRRVDLDMDNFWQYMDVNIVRSGDIVGTRLQIFPEVPNSMFFDTVVTYSVFSSLTGELPETRIIIVPIGGTAQTNFCRQAFPRIINISGVVEYHI